jgi:hypothetical protein
MQLIVDLLQDIGIIAVSIANIINVQRMNRAGI